MQNDWILDQIEMMTRFVGKVLFHKDLAPEEFHLVDARLFSEGDLTAISVKRLLDSGKLNEAENLIFEEIEADPSPRLLKIACDFYEALYGMDAETLQRANFGEDEIAQGLRDLMRIYGLQSL